MSATRCIAIVSLCVFNATAGYAQQDAAMPGIQHEPAMPLGSETIPPQTVGRSFTEPPPLPDQTAPQWSQRSSPGDDGQSPTYTLDTLLSLATQNNPTLCQSRLQITAQLARAMQAGLYPNPTVSYVGEQIGLENTAGEWQGAEIEQRFVTAGKLELSRNKYLQRAKIAEHLAVAQQFRVCNDVRIHFVRALASMQLLDLRRELLKTAEDNIVTMREMYNLGQANRADAHRAIALLQQHRLKVLAAHNDVQRHLLELAALVGIDTIEPLPEGALASGRPLIDFDAAYTQLIHRSPELLAAHAKLREDSITLNREKVQWVPDVVVSAGPGYNNVDRQTTAAARVSIEVPLFDRNQGTIAQAQADYTRQLHEIRRTQLNLRRRLASEYASYLSAYQHVSEYDAVILPSKREAYRLALESYKDNRAEWPDVLAAQEAYTTARTEYIDHQQMQRVSEILIDGFLLHGGLMTPNGPLPGGHIDSVPKPR